MRSVPDAGSGIPLPTVRSWAGTDTGSPRKRFLKCDVSAVSASLRVQSMQP